MIVTRFNPTTNGALHLGHIYSLLVNEHFAHNVGGKFYVRFDDTSQAITVEMEHKERLEGILKSQREIIEWLEIPVDEWIIQSEMLQNTHRILSLYGELFSDPYPHVLPTYVKMIGSGWLPYPYTPLETAERVIMDWLWDITHIIRGEEFSTEYSLYRYYCQMFNCPE